MPKLKLLRDVIARDYYDYLFSELSDFISNNTHNLDIRSGRIHSPDQATLYDFHIQKLYSNKSKDSEVLVDLVVACDIDVSESAKTDKEEDTLSQWFRISCSFDINDGIHNFTIHKINIYEPSQNENEHRLSEHLVPIIGKEEFDAYAEEILKKYYPEALESPQRVDVNELARRMGLKVEEYYMTQNCSIFGQVIFSDTVVDVYDPRAKVFKQEEVKRGTILVDPDTFFMRSLGSVNNTVAHECVHWELHKSFFELQKIFNTDLSRISCRVVEASNRGKEWAPYDWMEWHANAIAPRILMPYKQTKQKADELIARYMSDFNTGDIKAILEAVVIELSKFFGVSKQAAKIRLIDLGYKEAIGLYNYVDNRYVTNHYIGKADIKKNQTFSISTQDALYQYGANPQFREQIKTGNYIYVDSHFCVNDPKYVKSTETGSLELTQYALQHIDECCLIFDTRARKNPEYGETYYTECSLYKDAISSLVYESQYHYSGKNLEVVDIAASSAAIKKETQRLKKIVNELPGTFSGKLKAHMKREKITVEELCELSLVSPKTIQRIRNNEEYKTELGTVVALCIGLKLHPILSEDWLKKSGHSFKNTELHLTYQILLQSYYKSSIHACNELLVEGGFKPIGKEEI